MHVFRLDLRHVLILYLKRTKISFATPTLKIALEFGVKMSDRVQESVQNAILRRIDEELVESELTFTQYSFFLLNSQDLSSTLLQAQMM